MSSSSTITMDEFVQGRKLLVHVAENGHSFEFECDGSTPVGAIQRSIQSLCGVHFSDQLLLCRNTSLDSQQTLAHYKLPQGDDREVFLFNKSRFHADSPRPPPEAIDVPLPTLPSPPSPSGCPHPLDEALDPALKALGSYERQFRYHFQYANAIYGCSQAKFEVCKRLFREQQVQERALETARGNLDHTFRKLHRRYTEFMKCFNQQFLCHSELLNNFERDLERLRSLMLLPLLQTDTRKCLLDLVKESELRKSANSCLSSYKQFENKVLQLKQSFQELSKRVDNVFLGMDSAGSKDLELMIRDHQKVLNDQKSMMQTLSKDVTTVKKLVDDCLNSQFSASLCPHDAVSALGPMYEVHEKNHLPKMQKCDHTTGKLLDKSLSMKNEMNVLVHFCTQNVKSAQFSIKEMINELHAFQEVLGHREREIENLKLVNGISHAYRACLAEVVRRKSSSKLYMGLAGQLTERLATERESEIRKREGFQKTWSKYIPNDILASMGLFDSPTQCDVSIVPFDTNLIDIDVLDVDLSAPKSIIRMLPKYERSKLPCERVDFEENPLGSDKRFDSVGLVEGGLPIDISGTSKLEVENARLKADLATAIAVICSFNAEIGYETFDEIDPNNLLKTMKDKMAEVLHLKDEYIEDIKSLLNMRQVQCSTYEKRIHELEQRLVDQYQEGQKTLLNKSASESILTSLKSENYRGDTFVDGEAQNPYVSTLSMEVASYTSASADTWFELRGVPLCKYGEGGDENMIDLSGMFNMNSAESTKNFIDASMQETSHYEHQVGDVDEEGHGDTDKDAVGNIDNELGTRAPQCDLNENKLKAALDELSSLKRELEISRNLLDESQMNCAHLENCLHEAREEARTNLCTAERKASQYSALRVTAVKMHGLLERFRKCVTSSDEVANISDTLRSFALSLGSSVDDGEDDFATKFGTYILIVADKVGLLIRRVEHLGKQMEVQRELIKSLHRKHQLEKQASKEKISFLHFEVHELASFVLNSAGNYEAINRNCPNYYLSAESIALFAEHLGKPAYIIGQIVHIERQTVKQLSSLLITQDDQMKSMPSGCSNLFSLAAENSSNPYGLPAGTEYYIVTIAMLPDTIHSSPS